MGPRYASEVSAHCHAEAVGKGQGPVMAERGGLVKLPGGQTGDSKVRGERSNQGQGGGSGSGCAEGGPWGGGSSEARPAPLGWT